MLLRRGEDIDDPTTHGELSSLVDQISAGVRSGRKGLDE